LLLLLLLLLLQVTRELAGVRHQLVDSQTRSVQLKVLCKEVRRHCCCRLRCALGCMPNFCQQGPVRMALRLDVHTWHSLPEGKAQHTIVSDYSLYSRCAA
jgi:hypothetical protein